MRDDFERFLARDQAGLYESHYLKANAPDDEEAFWIKHNLLVPPGGGGIAEFWLVWFRRGDSPRVWKREVPMRELTLGEREVSLAGDGVRLTRDACEGRIGNASWQLTTGGALPPLFHFRYPRMYTAKLPKKKLLTPAPNLVFEGTFTIGERRVTLTRWVGLRGHNWGTEHAHSYAYGSCNKWDDGAADRALDAFTAKVRVGPVLTPWLSSLVYRGEGRRLDKNRVRDWLARDACVEPRRWRLPYSGASLLMEGDAGQYAGLRYLHPGGRESYCYNTKFARVTFQTATGTYTSRGGEHEVLYPKPLDGVPLHPTPGWSQSQGDYQSR